MPLVVVSDPELLVVDMVLDWLVIGWVKSRVFDCSRRLVGLQEGQEVLT